MSDAARRRLCGGFDVDPRKVTTIPHGAHDPDGARCRTSERPILLTWGLVGPARASSG